MLPVSLIKALCDDVSYAAVGCGYQNKNFYTLQIFEHLEAISIK